MVLDMFGIVEHALDLRGLMLYKIQNSDQFRIIDHGLNLWSVFVQYLAVSYHL